MGALVQIFFNVFRIFYMRLIHGKSFSASYIQRISFLTSFKITGKGQVKLGRNICISRFGDFFTEPEGYLEIGSRVFFNRGAIVSCQHKIVIGDNCLFGPDIKIYDNDHKFQREKGVSPSEYSSGEVIIGNNCWIGANAVILRDTRIGNNCVVGAGTIVKGNIPDNSLVTSDRKIKISPLTWQKEGI